MRRGDLLDPGAGPQVGRGLDEGLRDPEVLEPGKDLEGQEVDGEEASRAELGVDVT